MINLDTYILKVRKALLYKYNIRTNINIYESYSEEFNKNIKIYDARAGKQKIIKTSSKITLLKTLVEYLRKVEKENDKSTGTKNKA